MEKENREVIDEIKTLRYASAAMESRWHSSSNYDSRLDILYKDFPIEYKIAEREIYREIWPSQLNNNAEKPSQ